MSDRTEQKNNTAGRNIVAGNMVEISSQYNLHLYYPTYNFGSNNKKKKNLPNDNAEKLSYHENEKKYVDEKMSEYFGENKNDIILKGLEEKLTDGNLLYKKDIAFRHKEDVYRLCLRNSFNFSFCKELLYCMDDVEVAFTQCVTPMINESYPIKQIEKLTWDEVIKPLSEKYKKYDFTALTVSGIIFMLAGRCHIKWVP